MKSRIVEAVKVELTDKEKASVRDCNKVLEDLWHLCCRLGLTDIPFCRNVEKAIEAIEQTNILDVIEFNEITISQREKE